MKKRGKVLITGCLWAMCLGTFTSSASMNLETDSPVAGGSVALNNYFAGSQTPEDDLVETIQTTVKNHQLETPETVPNTPPETKAAKEEKKSSAYENIAISQVSEYVNVRTQPTTESDVVGKIYNNCAASILETVDGQDGKWYRIQSGTVNGFIKAQYFITGDEAEAKAKSVGTEYATVVDTPTLRLRESPSLESRTLTLLAQGAHYEVLEENGDFVKLAVDTDLKGYVFKDYIKINVEFEQAVSVEEEKAKAADEAKRKAEADEAIRKLEEAKREEAKQEEARREEAKRQSEAAAASSKAAEESRKAAESKARETTVATIETVTGKEDSGLIPANPDGSQTETTVQPPVVDETEKEKPIESATVPTKETEKETVKETTASSYGPKGPGDVGGASSQVTTATRNAIVAYAKQFLGNPYVYGGTSLTNGADCSGFTMQIYAHFGINTGRSSRDQAARGKEISVSSVQPGDLLFYASGDYINHVAMYIGGGQVIHASTPATGITIAPSNYRTPCKAVTFLD